MFCSSSNFLSLSSSIILFDLGTQPPSANDVNEVIKHLDTNKDGVISFDEFKVLIKDVLNAMIKQMEG